MITVPYPWITPIQSREDPRQLKSITGRKIMNIVNTLNLTKIQAGQGMKQETRIITRNYSKKIAKIKVRHCLMVFKCSTSIWESLCHVFFNFAEIF